MPGALIEPEPEAQTNPTHEATNTREPTQDRTRRSHESTSQTLDSPPMFEDSLSEGSSTRSTTIHHVNLQTSDSDSHEQPNPPHNPFPASQSHSQPPSHTHSPSSPYWDPADTLRFLTLVHQGMTLRQVHAFFPARSEVELWQYLGVCWRDGLFRVGDESSAGGGTPAYAVAMAGMAGRAGDPMNDGLAMRVAEGLLERIMERAGGRWKVEDGENGEHRENEEHRENGEDGGEGNGREEHEA